ncbi:transcriptional regulator, LacI family [Anaerobranca californiensis DSM 14826]|jgi:DNA-binding LacI/PurR family transcriptional regulator|uniref:Transcriptional regulator, LacI family n=1 Tax=Anaerobranca californiensis DSM 14826 TaxID=1120989 RepID=A0A1M6RNX1_9FIRM|nr:LacI family DNA-binding transcriptional regulator [Anaerobranca californiensis]SHK34090.1 transcriptional regulator, LacI family [Anaerobranca californiensis DSM 14826]
MKKGSVTIKDVAKKAGVSPSTVSRVISQNPRISKGTADKVLQCMKELGYYPNAVARSLASKKTGTVGVIMPTSSEDIFLNPFFPEVLRGIVKGASQSGYDLLLSTNFEKDEELKVVENFIRSSKVDGIILTYSKVNDQCIEFLCSEDFPFSLIGTPDIHKEKVNHVDNDNFQAAYQGIMDLIAEGRKRIAFLAGDKNLTVTQMRLAGYKEALRENGLSFDENLLYFGNFDEATGNLYGKVIAELEERPDGIIVTDDVIAFALVKSLQEFGIKIPEDIGLVSFNNSILAALANPPLNSVEVNPFKLGEEAMNLVVQAMTKGVRGKRTVIPYEIIYRNSTGT